MSEKLPEHQIDEDIEALRQIILQLNKLDDDERLRVFEYLKSKYNGEWPRD